MDTQFTALLTMLSLFLLSAANVFLIYRLIRGVRADDALLEHISSESGAIRSALSRLDPALGNLPASSKDSSGNLSPDEYQSDSLNRLTDSSMVAHDLLGEFNGLKGKELEAWKLSNQARIDRLLDEQAELRRKLQNAQTQFQESQQSLRNLRHQNSRLGELEGRAKAVEGVNEKLMNEFKTLKGHATRLKTDLLKARQETDKVRQDMVNQEKRHREQHEAYVKDRQRIKAEKDALEQGIITMNEAYDQQMLDLNTDDRLRTAHEDFMRERDKLTNEKNSLERRLQDLQAHFDRTMTEKAFIESMFLEMDASLNREPNKAA